MKLLKFYATWCSPCTALSNVFDTLGDAITIPVENVDVDKEPTMAAKYSIRSLPTLIIIDDAGTIVKRTSGSKTKDQLFDFITS